MKLMLSISNEMSRFKVVIRVYEVNVDTSFKNLNNIKSSTTLNT